MRFSASFNGSFASSRSAEGSTYTRAVWFDVEPIATPSPDGPTHRLVFRGEDAATVTPAILKAIESGAVDAKTGKKLEMPERATGTWNTIKGDDAGATTVWEIGTGDAEGCGSVQAELFGFYGSDNVAKDYATRIGATSESTRAALLLLLPVLGPGNRKHWKKVQPFAIRDGDPTKAAAKGAETVAKALASDSAKAAMRAHLLRLQPSLADNQTLLEQMVNFQVEAAAVAATPAPTPAPVAEPAKAGKGNRK